MTLIKSLDTENMSQQQVSEVLGVTVGMVQKYHKNDSGIPFCTDTGKASTNRQPRKFYRLPDILLWWVRYKGQVADQDLGPLDQARLEKLKVEVARETLKLETERGILLPADQIDLALGQTMAVVNTMREGHGDACAQAIYDGMSHEEKARIIQASIDAMFEKLNHVDFMTSVFPEDEDGEEADG